MSGIRAVDLGTFVASSEQAARTRSQTDPNQQRVAAQETAAYLEVRQRKKDQRVEDQDDAALVQRKHDEHPHDDAGTYDDHGRRHDDHEEDEHPHIDIAV